MEKTCFKCGKTLPMGEFYQHKKMADGHLNKCKGCTKSDVLKNKADRIDYYRAFDRDRGNRQPAEYFAAYRSKNPLRYLANNAVNNALRSGRITRLPCFVCGSTRSVAHHPDYSQPISVIWLCQAHHKQLHSAAAGAIASSRLASST
jgi:hypothetical protein